MGKVGWFRFQRCLVPLICCFAKCSMRIEFLEIWLTTFLEVCNLGNKAAVRSIFFLKMLKFNLGLKNAATNWEDVFCFCDNSIWVGCLKLSLLRREYLWSALNVLRNTVQNLPITKRYFFQLNCLHSDQ